MRRILEWVKGDVQYWRMRAETAEDKLTDLDGRVLEAEARIARWYHEYRKVLKKLVHEREQNVILQREVNVLRVSVDRTLTQGE